VLGSREEQRDAINPLFTDLVGHKDLVEVNFSRATIDTDKFKTDLSTGSRDSHGVHKLLPGVAITDNREIWRCTKPLTTVESFNAACVCHSIVDNRVPEANGIVTGFHIIELLLNPGVVRCEIPLRVAGS
jgi:hypothetical protein